MSSGPSSEERRQQQLLQQQQQQALAQQNQFFTQAAEKDPLAERLRASRMSWLDATEGKNGPFDVGKLEGMAPYLDLYNRARAKREGERVGVGALKMGLDASSPELAARIAEQRDTERQQDAAGGLENAFRAKDSEMRESVMPLINQKASKDLSLAGLASGNSNAAQDRYLAMLLRPKKRPFWQSMLTGGLGAVGSIFAGRGSDD
jgi:hypothetical protein